MAARCAMVYEVPRMVLGAHEGIAGGVSRAFERAEEDTAKAIQIFVRNPRGWASKPIPDD
jgi:deoxyribonuclease IV